MREGETACAERISGAELPRYLQTGVAGSLGLQGQRWKLGVFRDRQIWGKSRIGSSLGWWESGADGDDGTARRNGTS